MKPDSLRALDEMAVSTKRLEALCESAYNDIAALEAENERLLTETVVRTSRWESVCKGAFKDIETLEAKNERLLEALNLCWEQLSLHVADIEQSPEDKIALDAAVAEIYKE